VLGTSEQTVKACPIKPLIFYKLKNVQVLVDFFLTALAKS
jgi:hypothetical protein